MDAEKEAAESSIARLLMALDNRTERLKTGETPDYLKIVFACDDLISKARELGVAAFKASLPKLPH